MSKLTINTNPKVELKFKNYPESVKPKLNYLRQLIIETATEIDTIYEMEETLKWGEPSYLVKKGSTIRIDWKAKTPHQYAMYFQCTSQLVPTFKKLFPNTFNYQGTRAIEFKLDDKIAVSELKECIALALQYHLVKKNLPFV